MNETLNQLENLVADRGLRLKLCYQVCLMDGNRLLLTFRDELSMLNYLKEHPEYHK